MFANLKIASQLGLAFGVVVLLGAAQAGYSLLTLHALNGDVQLITEDRMLKVDQLADIKDNANIVARSVRNMVLVHEPADMAEELRRIEEATARNSELMKALEASVVTDKGRAALKDIENGRSAYRVTIDKVMALARDNKDAEATSVVLKELRPLQASYFKAVDAAIELQRGYAVEASQQARTSATRANVVLLVLSGSALLVGALTAWRISRSITGQLGGEPGQVVGLVNAIAEGRLDQDFQPRAGDHHSIVAAMRRMNDRLAQIVGEVRNSSDSIATGSAQIATGNADLSQRTEEQASNLQQTAASMEELSSTVKNNADTTQQAKTLAAQAAAAAAQGGETVGTVVATMTGIAASSKRIEDIIGVIDGIAFQTNILALNAAVEAARAGEQGRGFAVVASEVRSLAGRSSEAAREIKSLIGSSVEQVEAGTRQVDEARASMNTIVTQVQRVSQLISEISNATEEQSSGISQVGDAVAQLDQVTQQNAALVEESAAAAESLRQQAHTLSQAVALFRLGQASH